MNKEQQIAEMAEFVFDNIEYEITLGNEEYATEVNIDYKGFAEALYNAGYRKTFTSKLASDTQKAFKDGYIKGAIDRDIEIARLKAELAEFKKPIDKFIKDRETNAVKEFAEKLKAKAFQGYQVGMYIVDTKTIDELLKEYEK